MTTLGDVYRRAAQDVNLLRADRGCCLAIYFADSSNAEAERNFQKLFSPGNRPASDYWWPLNEAHRPVRVTALLLMAAMADAGDL